MSQTFAKVIDLLYLAKQNGVDVALNEDQLQLKLPKNKTVDKNLIEHLKNNKQLIIDFLTDRRRSSSAVERITRIQRNTIQHLPLSFSQERLWFIHQMEGSTQYHIPAVLRLQGKLEKNALAKALQHIVRRHEVLRTVFLQEDGQPYQVIRNWQDWDLALIDGSKYLDQQEDLQNYVQHLINQPFDLSKDYMVRANLIILREEEHVLVVTMHHIASDGWSTSIIVREVAELYAAYSERRESRLESLEIQYADYAVWQRNQLQGSTFNSKIDYWKNKLSGVSPLQLPSDRLRPAIRTSEGAVVDFSIDKVVSVQLQEINQQQDVTLYMTLLAAFKVLLHNYSGQDDICVGSPTANRTQHEIEGLIGFFVNTLALRSEVSDDISFSKFLQQVKGTTMDAFEHQDIPFEKVVELVVKERDVSRNPLFQVMFVLQNTPEVQQLRLGEMVLAKEELPHKTSKFDLTLFVVQTPNGLQCSIEYATDLFTESTIRKLAVHYKLLLESIAKTPNEKIGSLRMITETEEQQVIYDFNQTQADYPSTKSVVELFEEQVLKTPEATALVIGEDRLSYHELNQKANQLASYLKSKGVQSESLVPICVERGFLMVIGVIGILKTGAAYVPIDPEYPAERIAFMLDDSKAQVVIVSESTSSILQAPETVEVIRMDNHSSVLNSQSIENLEVDIHPGHLVYVLYTSGSTGRPKGVKMSGGGMVNLLCWQEKQFRNNKRRVLQFASLNFDVSFQEIFSTLCFGSTLILITSETRREIPEIIRVLEKQQVTYLFIPFIVLKSLVEYILTLPKIPFRLETIIVAGEQLKLTEDIWKFITREEIQLINQYGPTEAHVVTSYTIENSALLYPLPPIGKPIANSRIYILNARHKALPVNVPGEIYIAGAQVARGYLNNEKLTAEKFLDDPFSKEEGARMYKTGDLGRWLPDGNIEYLGRLDGQVKVRGYRIELGEIETVLHQHEGVRQAVVLAKEDNNGNNRLIAYVTATGKFDKQSTVKYLKEQLPDFMVPSLWVEMEKLPVTRNGKVDRKALPDPDASELLTNKYAPPRNETEAELAGIWQELLGVEHVGIHDNFFELGGHSLMAIRVISAIRKRMEVEVKIKDLFTYTTVGELAAHLVKQSSGNLLPALVATSRPENIPLSFSQERLWFIDQLEGSIQYHLSAVLRLKGHLDVSALNNSFKAVFDRHEVLRSVIYQVDGKPFIRIKDSNDFVISLVDRSADRQNSNELHQSISRLVNEPFDLSTDDMLRVSLIRVMEDEQILVVTTHHIASDGWSISILVKEVVELYESFIHHRTPALTRLEIQYPDYAIWQKNFLQGDVLAKKLDYWKQKLNSVPPIELPADYPRPGVRSNRGAMLLFSVDKQLTNRLQQLSQNNGVTLFMTLLGAFNVLIHRYSNQEDICVGTPVAGRQQDQLENLVGFFVNTLALRTEVNGNSSFEDILEKVRKTTLEAYEHQEVPFEKIVEAVVRERDMSRTPVFQVMFVFQNTPPIPALRLGDVKLIPEEYPLTTTQFDISFVIRQAEDGLHASVNYSTDLYRHTTIERMVFHFRQLLSAVVAQPGQAVGLLPMLSKEEELHLLHGFNNTRADHPSNKSIVALFEEGVANRPNKTALVFESEVLTYTSLNEKANQLAHVLAARGVTTETLVPICIEKSPDLMVGILAILKAGGVYVPIDPSYPVERVNFMIEDSNAKIIVTNKRSRRQLQFTPAVSILEVDEVSTAELISQQPLANPSTPVDASQLAYVMYTSGSTGRPKGVLIEHRNVVSLVRGVDYVSISADDNLLSTGSPSFDATTFEYWSMLLNGGQLVFCEEKRLLDAASLKEEIGLNKVSIMWFTSSWFNQLVENDITVFEGLRTILVGGEKLSEYHIRKVRAAFPHMLIVNGYGPTENTTFSLTYAIGEAEEGKSIPIGRPLSNRTAYILNKNLKPVPGGVTGEIYVGGAGVARSYLNRAELSKEKFIEDPFSDEPGSTLYRTGDLGRWLPDGNIEYQGRIDDQVKVRGYRVELSEIEIVLQQSEFVQQAIVLAKKDHTGSNRLVAYLVPRQDFNRPNLIAYLKDRLPEYMIPTSWVSLERFPLTANGKIDKKELPEPDADEVTKDYIAPRNEVEYILANVWQNVLSVRQVGITDNFFEIGGHSLLAMRLISQIRKELEVELSIKELFAYPTIEQLATRLRSGTSQMIMPPVVARARPENIPLSFSQERLWFIDQLEGSVQYHVPAVLRLKGDLDVSALTQAFRTIFDRHEVLRSVIYQVEGRPFIRVKAQNDLEISIVDNFQGGQDSNELRQFISRLVNERFDLSRDNMLRVSLIRVSKEEQILVLTMHHIASDGWSISVLVKEVVELYESFVQRRPAALPQLQIQYSDYATWQKDFLQGDVLDRKLEYWKQKLSGVSPIQLPTDRGRPAVRSNRGAMLRFAIDRELTDQLHKFSQENSVTVFMTLLSAFNVLMHRYSNQEDICVGTPVAGRQHEQLENLIGFFINTLALRTEVTSNSSFQDLLKQVRKTTLEAYEHQEVPFEKIVEAVVTERDMSRTPLFQVMFVFQNTPSVPALKLGEVQLTAVEHSYTTTQFDLSFIITDTSNGLQGSVNYSTDLYDHATIDRMVSHFRQLLSAVVIQPQQAVGILPILSKQEEEEVLYRFNNTKVDYPSNKNIIHLFEEQVRTNPHNRALISENDVLTYARLNERANQLAHYLSAKGVATETLVPICIEKSADLMIGILAILKAGGVYVPLDSGYPAERVNFMIDDTNAKIIVTNKRSRTDLQFSDSIEVLEVDDASVVEMLSKQPLINPSMNVRPNQLAYIMYTSGSTGRPKGVLIEHGNVVSLVRGMTYVSTSPDDILLSTGSPSFDATTFEYWSMLLNGGQLVFCDEKRLLDATSLKEEITGKKVSTMWFTSSWFNQLVENDITVFRGLKIILVGGEKLSEYHIRKVRAAFPDMSVINGYGPTENTTFSLTYKIGEIEEGRSIPIGKPLNNRSAYILDQHFKPVPIGVTGEIYVGGAGVARSYLNRAELSKEKFIEDPFSGEVTSRLYRTGDLGRWVADGNIEYQGRADDQVKVRGYRVELGEIETVLQQSELVQQAVVLAKKDHNGSNRLVAFVIPQGDFEKEKLIAQLKDKLPQYMIPTGWVSLESFPLTPNGKIDKRALPDPEADDRMKEYVAPTNETEQILVNIWQEVLSVSRVGINDNFFETGGHSLLAMRLISLIRKELKIEISIKELFTYPTVQGLAARIRSGSNEMLMPPVVATVRPENIPLSFSQERLWFIDQLEGSVQYHVPALLRLKGDLDVSALTNAFRTVLDRHEVLRSVIYELEGKPFIRIKEHNDLELSIVDTFADGENSNELRQYISRLVNEPFDLSSDNMLRASIIRLSGEEQILVVTMHHIASDGWSISILVKEIVELYESFIQGRSAALPALPIQYSDYAIWQKNFLQGDILDRKLDYWKQKLHNLSPIELPIDRARPPVRSHKGAVLGFVVDKPLTDQLQQLSHDNSVTLFMTLLAAFNVLLYRYSHQGDICVGTPVAGRQEEQLENLIGFFINTLALRNEVSSHSSFQDLLKQVRKTTLEAYEHQEVPFEKIVEAVVTERDMSRTPVFQVLFILQNTPPVPVIQLGEVKIAPEEHSYTTTQFDLSFIVTETSNGLQGSVNYSTDLYEDTTITRMVSHFQKLLSAIVIQPQQAVGLLPMLSKEEEEQLLYQFNQTKVGYPSNKNIIDLIQEQSTQNPTSVAVVFEDSSITYSTLNQRSNQVANYLIRRGVDHESIVPICIERGINMIVGLLGILKAGAAYTPIDPEYPEDRISYMLQDTGATLVIGSKTTRSKLEGIQNLQIINLDSDWHLVENESKQNLSVKSKPDSLAYVIYTSGSTGKPKGVMIEHRSVINLLMSISKQVQFNDKSVFLSVTTFSFDICYLEFYMPLVIGARLILVSRDVAMDGYKLAKSISHNRPTHMQGTPSTWQLLLEAHWKNSESLTMLVGGEAVRESLKNQLTGLGDVYNVYGPTETTIWSASTQLQTNQKVVIGKPLANTSIYILNEHNQLCPPKLAGEICIGGDGLARGYLNRPDLTAEKFILDPFSTEPGARLYRTGDLGRWLPDGNIEFISRLDDQVKVRGYRIELGEIEAVLHQTELVLQAVVLAKKDNTGTSQLVAYVIPAKEFNKQNLIDKLRDKLPQYMIPTSWVSLDSFPLTPNGKIDKKALPNPQEDELTPEYIAPTNETEEVLTNIWRQLLAISQVSIDDSFFEIGGHSLVAMRLISLIRKELKVELSIKDLFIYPTVRKLAAWLNTISRDITIPPVTAIQRPEFIPLSFSQERLWFIDRLEGTLHYHMPAGFRLKGDVDIEALNYALQQIVNRHEVLRSVIRENDGEPFQHILPENGLNLELIDGSAHESFQELQQKIKDLINEPFDLSKDHMIRGSLVKIKDQEYVLVITLHHIAGDGWSIPIVVNEVVELYNSFIERRAFRLPVLEIQYADYAMWQRQNLSGETLARKLEYWRKSLADLNPLQLPVDFPRPVIQSTRGAVRKIAPNKKLTFELEQLAQRQQATLFMTLLAAFKVLLYRYSGQHSICVGTPIAGRQQQELEDLIGFFVNTLALRTDMVDDESFVNLLARVKETTLDAYTHQDIPFEKVVEAVVKERDMSRTPLFQVMLILQNTGPASAIKLADVELSYETLAHTTSKFDITFNFAHTAEGMVGTVEYCIDLFSEATMDRMIAHFQNLLESIVQDPTQQVGMLSMLSREEEVKLIRNFNGTETGYPKHKTIVDLFEEQVLSTPDAPAVVFRGESLSYKQLNAKANQLAHYLVSRGIKQGSLVPLCVERSVEMILCVLAILKTGSAYVPIDSSDPKERIRFKVNETKAAIVITSEKSTHKVQSDFPIEIFDINTNWWVVGSEPTNNLNVRIKPHNLVYVIYTSGTTGKPKGVQMQGTGLVNLLLWQDTQFSNKNRHVLQFASLNFDVSFQEIFSTLCFGSTLYLITEENRRDPAKLVEELKRNGITHLFVPYIVLKTLAEYILASGDISLPLEEVIVAGEQLKITEDIHALLDKGKIEVINQYGPTEAHVVSSYRVDKASTTVLPPIGKPISNTQLYILSESKSLLPVGVSGEIYIGGVQVARGYLNRPQLTEEKFVPDPFSSEKDARLYRTGDLGKWLPDGNMEYLGRIDDQVKIRGYRIEIAEVESVLQQFERVRQAAVIATDDAAGNKRLIGFVVPEGNFHPDDIISFLKQRLPDYMVPAQWVKMENMPVTGNGKVDRKALPLPDLLPLHPYLEPQNEMEEKVLEIFQKLLGVQNIGVKDNFFEVGGHSLLAMRLIAAIRKQMGIDLPLTDIYGSDIQSLADKIVRQQRINNIDVRNLTGDPGSSTDLTEALEMVHRMEKGTVEWEANGHGKYLVPIRKDGTRNPFFGIISFKHYCLLGSLMPDDQPLFYLPPTRSASVEEIASHYIKEMKAVHPKGPYTIGGFCAAGMVALEIAHQLEAQGDKVSAVILFEFYAPDSTLPKRSIRYRKRKLAHYKRRLIAYKKLSYSGLDLFKFVVKKSYQRFKDFVKPPPPKFITSPKYGTYRHKPYSGRVILFQASIAPLEATDSPLMGWSKYLSGDVRLITIPGGHLGIFRQPEVQKLAEELTAVLKELNNEATEIQKSLS